MDKKTFKQARLALGKSQEEMGAALGVSSRHISRWETGTTPIPDDMKDRIERLDSNETPNLSRIASIVLIKELESRAQQWDQYARKTRSPYDLGASTHRGKRMRLVASDMTEHGD